MLQMTILYCPFLTKTSVFRLAARNILLLAQSTFFLEIIPFEIPEEYSPTVLKKTKDASSIHFFAYYGLNAEAVITLLRHETVDRIRTGILSPTTFQT